MGAVGRRNNNSLELTPEHDALTIWLHSNYKEYVSKIVQDTLVGDSTKPDFDLANLDINLEPCLSGYPLLFPDATVVVELKHYNSRTLFHIAFEIKPRIASLGATLRQVKLYSRRLRIATGVVVTHTTNYDALLLQQHIHVIHPPEGVGDPQSRMNRLETEV